MVGKQSMLVVEDNPLSRATAVDMFKKSRLHGA